MVKATKEMQMKKGWRFLKAFSLWNHQHDYGALDLQLNGLDRGPEEKIAQASAVNPFRV